MKFFAIILISFFSFADQEPKTDLEQFRQVIKSDIKSIRTCYNDGVKIKPNIKGKVIIEWEIIADGSVSNARVKSSALKDKAVETCIVERIKTLKFPIPPNDTGFKIIYPFVFSKIKLEDK